LPLDATPALLENEFQKFGLIRTNGIQVRSQKVKESIFNICSTVLIVSNLQSIYSFEYCGLQGFCFGFVEFESASSMQSAIEVRTNGITSELFKVLNILR